VQVGSRTVLGLTPPDIDELSGETLDDVGRQTVARMRQALDEAAEARAPGALVRAGVLAFLALAVTLGLLWAIARVHDGVLGKLTRAAERTVARSGLADLDTLRGSRLLEFQQRAASTIFVALGGIVTYVGVTFVLRRFPYTRPWGESMRAFLVTTIADLATSMARAIPGLFTVVLIALIVRFLVRLVRLWSDAIERGRVKARWIHPETAQPTRRLLTALLWLFAIVMAYPYLPGSQTEAFKGVSVFIGLMVTLGSSGLVNQIMSGFMITYSRALRLGDFVRAGEVEGTVIHLGVLSTKIRTVLSEEVTVPNAVIISQTITDYSRLGDTQGVFTPTSVTIGYDAPWRQVQTLLLQAAERTPGLRRTPKPLVLQASLDDFYVKYTLLVALEDQESRLLTLHALHAHIQDLFNEFGVQIMSPNYVLDPAAPKVVAKKDWFAAPARPDPHVEIAG
jgi:small-conductance mechanosensitive channel